VPALARALKQTPRARVFLTVPDRLVAPIASTIARSEVPRGLAFVHTSGALGLEALGALRARHAAGSFHPLQSFPKPRRPDAFRGIVIGWDASTEALAKNLVRLARDLGAAPRRVKDADRALYHSAAAFASNYLIVLFHEAAAILEQIGWNERQSVATLAPLMQGVIENVSQSGIQKALTGPIRRGDVATVSRHLQALAGRPQIEAVYRMLGAVALEIAVESGLDPKAAGQMKVALTRKRAATRRNVR